MFAGTVMLGDLDDFIVPAQACVNPLFTDVPKQQATSNGEGQLAHLAEGTTQLMIESDFLGGVRYGANGIRCVRRQEVATTCDAVIRRF